MKGLVGAPCWWGAWGPGPLPPPIKSGPGIHTFYVVRTFADDNQLYIHCQLEDV